MGVQVEKLEKNMAKLTIEFLLKNLKQHWRKLIRKIKVTLHFRVSVKEKLRAR